MATKFCQPRDVEVAHFPVTVVVVYILGQSFASACQFGSRAAFHRCVIRPTVLSITLNALVKQLGQRKTGILSFAVAL